MTLCLLSLINKGSRHYIHTLPLRQIRAQEHRSVTREPRTAIHLGPNSPKEGRSKHPRDLTRRQRELIQASLRVQHPNKEDWSRHHPQIDCHRSEQCHLIGSSTHAQRASKFIKKKNHYRKLISLTDFYLILLTYLFVSFLSFETKRLIVT